MSGADRVIEALAAHVPDVLRVTDTPGVTVAVADASGLRWEAAFGVADLAAGTPMQPDHVMPGGSLTKLPLVVALMQQVHTGSLDLHCPVEQRINIQATNPFGCTPVTPWQLATHTSGLATDTYDATLGIPAPLAEHLAAAFARPRATEYGGVGPRWAGRAGSYRYSNLGSATLGHLVAETNPDRLSFSDYVTRRVFDPLALTSTCIPPIQTAPSVPLNLLARRCTGYARFGQWCVPTPQLHSAIFPSVGILTTAGDFARLIAALFLPAHAAYGTVISPTAVRSIITPQVVGHQGGHTQEIGLLVNMGDTTTTQAWIGGAGQYPWGWTSLAHIWPHYGLVVVSMANCWDMVRYNNVGRAAPVRIFQLVTDWLTRGYAPQPAPRRPRQWRNAHAAGLLMGERTTGLLCTPSGLTPEVIASMADEARSLHAPDDSWDPAAFAAGVNDAITAGPSAHGLEALISSDQIDRTELDLAALHWGATDPRFPVPLPYIAERHEQSDVRHLDPYTSEGRRTMIDLSNIRAGWDHAAREDAMRNIITDTEPPAGWTRDTFFELGVSEITAVLERLDSLALRVAPHRRATALDFGCGIGRLTQALAAHYGTCTGVDISPEMVRQAREIASAPCVYLVNATNGLQQFADGAFDLVYCSLVLMHMPPELAAGYVREFIRVLSDGGLAVFQVPDGPDVHDERHWLSVYGTPSESVAAWVRGAGGEIIDVTVAEDTTGFTSYRYTARRTHTLPGDVL
jgi:CubicO group peptidase (beta-lactamase class C family)/SAM-dependent methyltransferase